MKTSEFIDEARGEIYSNGWVQGDYANVDGYCILGALDAVAMRHLSDIPVRAQAQEYIEKLAAELFPDVWSGSIPSFNDNHRTSKQDVLDLLDKVTISLEEVGE